MTPILTALAILSVATPKPVVVVSWDGAPNFVVQRMLKQGKLPAVARLVRRGWIADGSETVWPSKTAVSHFAAFSGTTPGKSGVTGNAVPLLPKSEHTLLETRSGFDAHSHFVDPLWVYAAKQGKKVLALSAAGSYPPAPDVARLKAAGADTPLYKQFSGFEATIQSGKLWKNSNGQPLSFKVGDQTFTVTPGRGSVMVTQDGNSARVPLAEVGKTDAWSKPFWVSKGSLKAPVSFRLWSITPGGDFELYQWKASGMQGTESAEANEAYLKEYGAFHDDSLGLYERGEFGPTLWQGGDGQAEERQLEIVRKDCEFLSRSFRWGLKQKPDLMFQYSPMVDSTGHTLMGVMDPESSKYNAATAAKLQPFYERVIQEVDAWLGRMMDDAGPNAAFVLMSDHGMAGVGKSLYVNKVLESAGLASFKDRSIDLANSKVFAPPSGDFYVTVNTTEWKGGIIPPSQKEAVLDAAQSALLAFVDPETGQHPVKRVFRGAELARLGLVGPTAGDLYLDLLPDYYPRNGNAPAAVVKSSSPIGDGVHGFNPARANMLAILAAGGQGVPVRSSVGRTRHVQIFATVCDLLGLPVPQGLDGTAVTPRGRSAETSARDH